MSLPTALILTSQGIFMIKAQEPWATQVKPYLAAYGNPKLLFLFWWSWFKFSVVHIWRAELDNSWVVRGNTTSFAVLVGTGQWGRQCIRVTSPMEHWPLVNIPSLTACTATKPLPSLLWDLCGGDAGKWSFLYVEKISYWDQVYSRMYYCSMRPSKSQEKRGWFSTSVANVALCASAGLP